MPTRNNKHRIQGRAYNSGASLQRFTTEQLVRELEKREGVKQVEVEPYIDVEHALIGEIDGITGPAVVLIITD